MTWAERFAIWLTLGVAIFALYLALDTIHESRDIALEAEEEKMLPSLELNSALFAESSDARVQDSFQELQATQWDVEIHRRLKDNRIMRFLMHGKISAGSEDERALLAKLAEFRSRRARARFSEMEAAEVKRILSVGEKDELEAADELGRLVTTGYYVKSFKNWDDGKTAIVGIPLKNDDRQRLIRLFNVIERPMAEP